jgi:mannitol-1-phosphate 5-dehydrogenase
MAVFGAGNIGRGFIGQIFSQSGYDVVFIDAVESLVNELNAKGYYPLELVTNDETITYEIGPVSACLAQNQEQVNQIISKADAMATAVGVPVLPKIAPGLAAAFAARKASGNNSELDILVCENKLGAGDYLRSLILEINPDLKMMLENKIGFVETSIGRMVPVLSEQERRENPLLVRSEPYSELPVDASGFRGAVPAVSNLKPFTPFDFYHERKLFIHNMGHAVTAYLGYLAGAATIAEAINRPELRLFVEKTMRQTAQALSEHYGVEYNQLEDHVQDLLSRFANIRLGDTVSRVGRDPLRKLDKQDRLAGALRFTVEQGKQPYHLALAMAAALKFDAEGDPTAAQVSDRISDEGLDYFLKNHCGLSGNGQLDSWRDLITAQYDFLNTI